MASCLNGIKHLVAVIGKWGVHRLRALELFYGRYRLARGRRTGTGRSLIGEMEGVESGSTASGFRQAG